MQTHIHETHTHTHTDLNCPLKADLAIREKMNKWMKCGMILGGRVKTPGEEADERSRRGGGGE